MLINTDIFYCKYHVTIQAVLSLHYYESGIYKSLECNGDANHAVAAVAYTPQYILIKNRYYCSPM